MSQVDNASSIQLQQQFGDLTVSDGAFGFQGVLNGDLHLNKPPSDSRKNLAEAAFNSKDKQHKGSCLEGTRRDVLEQIRTWADGGGEKRMYWLKGMAGTGKSTIALTIAREYHGSQRLGASFFFERGGGDLGSATEFAATVSSQLEGISNPLKKLILKAASSSGRIDALGLYDQWEKLVIQPLSKLTGFELKPPVLMVVDALDECSDEDDMALLIKLLAKVTTLPSIHIRVFITSRPDPPLIIGFGAISGQERRDFVLHDIEQSIVDQDIAAYYHSQLSKSNLSSAEDIIQILVKRSQGLFIHAATNGASSANAEIALDNIYSTVLEQSLGVKSSTRQSEDLNLSRHFSCVVGSIVALSDAMSVPDLSTMIARSEKDIRLIIDSIHSVLDVPSSQQVGKTIRLVHPSFRDFLLSPERNSHRVFSVDVQDVHGYLLSRCFTVMENNLRRNMCDLERPGTRAKDVSKVELDGKIPKPVQYACRYWVHHLRQSNIRLTENAEVVAFFRERFLFWLETLSWTRQLSEALNMVTELVKMMDQSREPQSRSGRARMLAVFSKFRPSGKGLNSPPALHRMLYDAYRFLRSHIQAIQEAPLQAYCSGILFSPQSSVTRNLYSNQAPDWILHKSSATYSWSSSLRVLRVESQITLAAFSPGGGHLAILLNDGHTLQNDGRTLQIVDAVTNSRRDVKRRCSGPGTALSFSPDGQMLLCTSQPGPDCKSKSRRHFETIDVHTAQVQLTLEGHEESVLSVGFVSGSTLVLSQPDQGSARLWDLATATTRFLLDDPGNSSGALSPLRKGELSPGGRFLFTVREDGTSQLWDTTTGKAQTVQGHSVTFSPQGQFVALEVTENHSPSKLCVLNFAQHWVEKVTLVVPFLTQAALSPDCRFIATQSIGRIRLWDINGNELMKGQLRFTGSVNMAFSNDSKLIACANGRQIKIWETAGQAPARKLLHDEFQGMARGIAFSPKGEMLTSVSGEYIQLWDTRENFLEDDPTIFRTKKRASQDVPLVCPVQTETAISHDHNIVAVAYKSKIEVWDAAGGSIIRTLAAGGYGKLVSTIGLSPDGQLIAAAFPGGPFHIISALRPSSHIVLWNINTGSRQDFYTVDHWSVRSLVFSGDSSVLAAAGERNVEVWTTAGKELSKFASDYGKFLSITISPTGDLMMMSVWDKEEIWKVSGILQGVPVQTRLEVGFKNMFTISLSPDGRLFAAYGDREGGSLHLWDVTGTQLFTRKTFSHLIQEDDAYREHSCRVLAFSPDGKRLAGLFTDGIDEPETKGVVRLWDMVTGDLLGSYEVQRTRPPSHLSFSPCGNLLLTRDGAKRLSGVSQRSSPAIFIEDSWIKNGNEDLIVLPADYRQSVLFAVGRNVVFMHRFHERLLQFSDSGRFTFPTR